MYAPQTFFAALCTATLIGACGSASPMPAAEGGQAAALPTPAAANPTSAAANPTSAAAAETPTRAKARQPSPNDTASPLPQHFEGIGEACNAPQAQHASRVLCSNHNRITGLYQPGDFLLQPPPEGALIVADRKKIGSHPRAKSLLVAIDGSRIWVRRLTCPGCRRIMGWSFLGELPLMSDEDLLALQSKLKLPATAALRSAEAWRAAFSAR